MNRKIQFRGLLFFIAFGVSSFAARAQITSFEGDGVLNAPYHGTIDSLRACTPNVGSGEVKSHVESLDEDLPITSSTIDIWAEGVWDRSVLRLFRGLDASGDEVDLTDTSPISFATMPTGIGGFNRFSLKAIGTKTLEVQTFTITFHYEINYGTEVYSTQTFDVAPVSGSFCSLPGESEAFHYGTPVLDVTVGGARLTVPIGQTAEMIGAAYSNRKIGFGPAYLIERSDVVLPGAGESVHIQNGGQFRLGGYAEGPDKTDYGTPWPGHLVGYVNYGDVYGPDGTHFDTPSGTDDGLYRFNYIRPFSLSENHDATQVYTYDGSNRVTEIRDRATTPNVITLQRTAGVVTRITTSDGRGWTIGSDPVDGWITSIEPDGGQGDRHFTYTTSPTDPEATPRVRQVKDADQNVMFEFVYDLDGDNVPTELLEEWRYVDGAMQKVVEHEVVSNSLRRRKEFTGPGEYRQYDFAYDTAALLSHRLASVTSYAEVNGAGATYATVYTHDVANPRGNMVVTEETLPDGTTLTHEYDAHVLAGTADFGFRTKTTHTGPTDGSLVTYDVEYEFLYQYYSYWRLFPLPRIVKQRDGRGAISEVVFDYEDGGDDYTFDGLYGEKSNQLLSRTGPTITLGYSSTHTPQTRYTHDSSDRVLSRTETDYASGASRAIEYDYDDLLRLTAQTVDPGGESLVTQYAYCDADATQDRITVDPDGYWTRTEHDNDGRTATIRRYLNANAGNIGQPCTNPTGPFYETTYVYDTQGRLHQQIEDHKDQDGNALTPATITTEPTYDRLGRLTLRTVDPGGVGQESNFDYNWLGEIEREFDTSGRGTQRTYDGRGLVDTQTPLALDETPDPNLTTTLQYDGLGRLRFTNRPTGAVHERGYDDFGRVEQNKRAPGPDGGNLITTTFEYDDANNATRTYVDEATVGVLSDSTAKYDEGGFNYETRQRTSAGADGATDPVTQRKFDWAGNVTEARSLGDVTVGDRVVTTYYDDANRVERTTDSEGGETTLARDDRGNVIEQTVKLTASDSAVTTTIYDALSRPTRITGSADSQGLRHYRESKHDSRSLLLRETAYTSANSAKQTTVIAYDSAGRQTRSATLADASAVTTPAASADVSTDRVVDSEHDTDGRLSFRKTYNNNASAELVTATTYDSLGRVDRVTDPSNSYADQDYNSNGRLEQRVVFDGVGTRTFTFGYDGHDRITSQTAQGSPSLTTSFELDGLDRQTEIADPKGIKTKTGFDLVGRRKERIEDYGGALERETLFSYNRLSQLIEQAAGNKASGGAPLADQVTSYRYDTLSRQRRAVYPDSPDHADPESCTDCERIEYDLGGRMTTRTDQRGLVTTFTHDDRSLPLTRTTGTDRDTFDYDALGRLTLAQRGTAADPDAVSSSDMAYTDLGDLDYETQTIAAATPRTADYTHDQAGNRIGLDYPSGEGLTYAPTALNQVDSIDLNGSPLMVDYQYNGRLLDRRRT
ncbi:MAG: RHS repeat protein, partial [bacterium]|nr:RHS repeat protein [bacterium]